MAAQFDWDDFYKNVEIRLSLNYFSSDPRNNIFFEKLCPIIGNCTKISVDLPLLIRDSLTLITFLAFLSKLLGCVSTRLGGKRAASESAAVSPSESRLHPAPSSRNVTTYRPETAAIQPIAMWGIEKMHHLDRSRERSRSCRGGNHCPCKPSHFRRRQVETSKGKIEGSNFGGGNLGRKRCRPARRPA